jgi:hypothetical protein
MMNWIINPIVTINGTNFTAETLNGLKITYGRSDIWEQARTSTAYIQILNDDDSVFTGQLNDPVVVQIDDSAGDPITVFTGKLNTISNSIQALGSSAKVVIHTITAVGSFAAMARALTHTSAYPKEYDDDRLTRILTDAGVSIDVIDSPGVYEFTQSTANPGDCYYWASYYANMAFGYIYETPAGEVGYANESRRTLDAQANGYLIIPEDVILYPSVQSEVNLNNLLNDLRLEWKNNQIVTSTSASSIASYGKRAADIVTELEDGTQAQFQADRYITLRSTPATVLQSFTVQLDAPGMTAGTLDDLLSVYMGLPIEVSDFPNGIYNGIFKGFVEGWTLVINRVQATLNLNVTKNTLSITPTRWQDVDPALIWSAIDPALEWADYE